MNPKWFLSFDLSLLSVLMKIHFLSVVFVQAELQFCFKGSQKLLTDLNYPIVVNDSVLDCPYGVLFKEPRIIGETQSDGSEFCVRKNVCSDAPWECENLVQYSKAQLIVPTRPISDHWDALTNDNFVDQSIPACIPLGQDLKENALERNRMDSSNSLQLKRNKRQAIVIPPEEDASKYTESKIQDALDEQTKRLFYYLGGINPEEVNSHLRAVQLFIKSIRIVHMICDSKYLPEEFLDNVEKAFMFLLKEQGLERITDVDVDDYELLRRALELCMSDPNGYVEFLGNHCPANFFVEGVKRNGVNMSFDRTDEANFHYGRYDVTVDSAWHVIDIVHGMCFATFRANLNLHHKYEVVMEQLFHDTLYHRWQTITELKKESEYNNIFMADINKTMEVLDACAQGSYIGSPFIHRLSRPIKDGGARKKRSIQLKQNGNSQVEKTTLEDIAYCFKSPEEKYIKLSQLRINICSKINPF